MKIVCKSNAPKSIAPAYSIKKVSEGIFYLQLTLPDKYSIRDISVKQGEVILNLISRYDYEFIIYNDSVYNIYISEDDRTLSGVLLERSHLTDLI